MGVFEGEGHIPAVTPSFIFHRGRRAPLALLAVMGYRVLWGFLVLLDPRVWLERMETR